MNFKNQSQHFMATLRNFKNQSHLFMTIFSNLRNQGVASHSKIKTLGYFRLRFSALEIQHATGENQYRQAQN